MKARPLSSTQKSREEENDIENRYKIIVPDAVHSFPVRKPIILNKSWRMLASFAAVLRVVMQRFVLQYDLKNCCEECYECVGWARMEGGRFRGRKVNLSGK